MIRILTIVLLAAGCSGAPAVQPDDGGAPPPPDLATNPSLSWSQAAITIAPGRDHHATLVATTQAGPALYVLGGTDHYASYVLDDVQRAPIASDGTPGPFVKIGTLPRKLAGHSIALVGDTVVISGGVTVNASGKYSLTPATSLARLQADGSLSAWQDGPPIASGREHHSMLVSGKTVFVVGGLIGTDGTTDVESATVSDDGTLSQWIVTTPLPQKRSHHAAALVNGRIYVVGGLQGNPAGASMSLSDVIAAPVNGDGTLGAWSTVSNLPVTVATHSVAAFESWLYVIGGIENDVDFVPSVRRAPIRDDGSIGDWQDASALPDARGHVLETPMWNSTLYSVGGSNDTNGAMTQVVVGRFQ